MAEIPQTRKTLILRLQNESDARAWAEFAEIYQPLIFRLALAKGLQAADAQDVVQEVLTRIAAAINRFDPHPGSGSFRGWISTITRNMVIDFLRSRRRIQEVQDAGSMTALYERVPAKDEETQLFDLEHERQMFLWASEKIRNDFAEATWLAFWTTAVESKSVAETAEQLNISRGAVYIARSRVMAKLKSTIEAARFESGFFQQEGDHE